METSLRPFPQILLGALLFSACLKHGGLRVLDASAGPAGESSPSSEASTTSGGMDVGGNVLVIPDAKLDSAPTRVDVPGRCGDGIKNGHEECDDGNTVSGDGCSSICRIECCVYPEPVCPAFGGCRETVCGNGVLTSNEVCDDGNTVGGDGCSADCQAVEPGFHCGAPGKKCTPICGDHVLNGTETCDDGNIVDGDGCSAYCLTEAGWDCSSGVCVQVSTVDGGAFNSGVHGPYCGDGIISGDEECDDGASNDDSAYGGCTTKCLFGPFCGDGTVNGPEGCDLGKLNGSVVGKGSCTLGCTTPHTCGDGIVDPGEDCDLGDLNGLKLDSNLRPTDDPTGMVYCTTNCAIPYCCVLF